MLVVVVSAVWWTCISSHREFTNCFLSSNFSRLFFNHWNHPDRIEFCAGSRMIGERKLLLEIEFSSRVMILILYVSMTLVEVGAYKYSEGRSTRNHCGVWSSEIIINSVLTKLSLFRFSLHMDTHYYSYNNKNKRFANFKQKN